jgi:single-strand DNA-binding protein
LATEPEIKPTKNSVLTRFRVAVNNRRKQGDTWVDDPSFFTVICWKDLASHVAESLSKGDRVLVRGRLKENTWTDNEGNEQRRVEVVAEDVAVSLMFATVDKIDRVSSVSRPKLDGKSAMERTGFPTDEEPF